MASPKASAPRFHSSDLSRDSARVFTAAEQQPVVVTRRDAESLVLMSEHEAKAREELFALAAQLIAVTTDSHGTLKDRMADRLPWMLALGDEDQAQCADELVRSARAAFATGQAECAIATLTAWRETAAALAAGLGGEVDWLDRAEPVPRP